ncbi:MAG: methyltransferase domain-containing protein [bacterium]|nr:methyltransferase domain-containing protein [bacterium]
MPDTPPNAHALHHALIDLLKRQRVIRSATVETAFRAVPRHRFLPTTPLEQVYADAVVPTKFAGTEPISSSSQPSMMAIMLEQGAFKPGQRVLEIGAGTGFNAALMSHMVGVRGQVTALDIDDDLIENARRALSSVALPSPVVLHRADGWQGYPDHAPYDRIILTVQAHDLAPAWFDQLKDGGRLIVPLDVWAGAQFSVTFVKRRDHLVSASVSPCGFMPLRGEAAAQAGETAVNRDERLLVTQLQHTRPPAHTLESLRGLLEAPGRAWESGISAPAYRLHSSGFWLWLAARAPDVIDIRAAQDKNGVETTLPMLFGKPGAWSQTYGLASVDGLALLYAVPFQKGDRTQTVRIGVRAWGDGSPLRRLMGALRAWNAAGQPDSRSLRLAAFPGTLPPGKRLPPQVITLQKAQFAYALKH